MYDDEFLMQLVGGSQLLKAAAMCILKMRECHCIPLSVMDSIISDVQSLYKVALQQLGDHVQHALNEAGVDPDVIHSVTGEIADGAHTQLFEGLATQSQQIAYFKDHFKFVVSYNVPGQGATSDPLLTHTCS